MAIETALDKVNTLKESAKANRDFGDFEDALDDLMKAVDLLEKNNHIIAVHDLNKAYADCFGMMGGIYRRMNNLQESAQMYRKGLTYEQNDSYNLVNSIVVPLIANPANFDKYKSEIQNADQILTRQIEGDRGTQWWAWADKGLISVLVGDLESAKIAYNNFKDKKARVEDFESSIKVLRELEQSLSQTSKKVSTVISEAILYLESIKPHAI